MHPVTEYALDVVEGRTIANKWGRLACKRHLDDLEEGKNRGLFFDEDSADHIIDFFEEFLVFYEGAFNGQPFLLTPWQKFLLGSILVGKGRLTVSGDSGPSIVRHLKVKVNLPLPEG